MQKKLFHNPGFTLAEVLITLGIIGIVAAMTLPAVINNAKDRQFRAMFKKQYSIISQAFQMVYLENGEEIQFTDWREMTDYVCKIGIKLKSVESGLKCDEILKMQPGDSFVAHVNPQTSWHATGKWHNAQKSPMFLNSGYSHMTFILQDGAMINFNCYRYIFVDVNGGKKPNTIGRDIFYFQIPKNSSTPNFFNQNGNASINSCSGANFATNINRENYEEDCLNGSGWGCSPMYILK